MTDDVTRIGRGVPTSSRPEPAAAPSSRRPQPLLIALAAVFIGVGLAAGLYFTGVIGPNAAPPPQVPMPIASSPDLKVLDERAACVLLVPVVTDAGNLAFGALADPNKADWPKVQQTYDNLKLMAAMSPAELRDDVGQISTMLLQLLTMSRTGGTMTFDTGDFKSAGLRIGARCAKYAS